MQEASKILPTTGYRGVIKTINLVIDLWLCCLLYLADKIHELLECVHCHRSPSIDIPWRGPQGKRAFIWFMPIMWFLQTWNNYLLCFIKKQYLQIENSVESVTSQATEKYYMVNVFWVIPVPFNFLHLKEIWIYLITSWKDIGQCIILYLGALLKK